jgi:hypothetical protein
VLCGPASASVVGSGRMGASFPELDPRWLDLTNTAETELKQ